MGQLRLAAWVEGTSYLLLFGLSMPLKYIWDIPGPNKVIGMLHGIFFVLYCLLVLLAGKRFGWGLGKLLLALLASLVPFGTFAVDYKWLRK